MINTTTIPKSSKKVTADPAPQVRSESRIDGDSHFNGLYETQQDLRIEGVAEGEIRCEGTLTVVEGARVVARVSASAVTIAGQLEGEVVCRGLFQIMPSGQVEATVQARRLTVQEGGLYNGEFRMITGDPPAFPVNPVASGTVDPGLPVAAAGAEDSAGLLSSDEWWTKMMGTNGDGSEEKPS